MHSLLTSVRAHMRASCGNTPSVLTPQYACAQFLGSLRSRGAPASYDLAATMLDFALADTSTLLVLSGSAMQHIDCSCRGLHAMRAAATNPIPGDLCGLVATPHATLVCSSSSLGFVDHASDNAFCVTSNSFTQNILCVTSTPDGAYFATGGSNMTITVWSKSLQVHRCLSGHTDWVRFVRFARGPASALRLFSTGDDGMIYLWDPVVGVALGRVNYSHGSSIQVFDVAFRSGRIAVAYNSPVIALYRQHDKVTRTTHRATTLTRRSRSLSSYNNNNTASLPSSLSPPPLPPQPPRQAVDSGADEAGDAVLHLLQIGLVATAHRAVATAVRFTPNGEWLVSAAEDETLAVTCVRDSRRTFTCATFVSRRSCMTFMSTFSSICILAAPPTSSAVIVAACAIDGMVVQWVVDVRTGRCSYTRALQLHLGALLCIDYTSPTATTATRTAAHAA